MCGACEQPMNASFDSPTCTALRANCGQNAYFEICLDFEHQICVCDCPRDKRGMFCEEFKDFECKLNVLSANMTECEQMTQSELDAHGRDDYDVTMDGDKPCFFVQDDADGFIESVVALSCS